ncbi:MAG: ATP-binding cassette domain-containing protein [Alphaproteobacteria bacterium]
MPYILTTDKICRNFDRLHAVDHISLNVEAGEVFGLLGRNGAGKSTLIKMLTTLLPPTSGAATIGGFDLQRQSTQVRRLVGYVPQALSADGELTGYDNLLIFAKIYDMPRGLRETQIKESLAFMGLTEAADKLVKTYSGGMVRRLEIAQSMLHKPAILFLDEPTIGLDPVAREAVWRHVRQLRETYKTTIFLTTHYMEEVEELCTRIAIMRRGKIVALGSQAELRAAHKNNDASLGDIFAHYTEDETEADGGYREIAKTRKKAHRLQ